MSTLIVAAHFAAEKHKGQKRKYTSEDYIHHPLRVMNRVLIYPKIPGSRTAAAMAAVLHDVVEDCGVPLREIRDQFGADVELLVEGLTNVFTKANYPELNRAKRQALEANRLGSCRDEIRIIKMFDRIDNLQSFFPLQEEMLGFARVYVKESEDLAKAIVQAAPLLGVELYHLTTSLRFEINYLADCP